MNFYFSDSQLEKADEILQEKNNTLVIEPKAVSSWMDKSRMTRNPSKSFITRVFDTLLGVSK